jgi:hypothetical protein
MNGKTTYKGTISLLVCAFLFALAFVSFVSAQTSTTTVTGSVTDGQGSVIAGATVRLVNVTKGLSRTTVTSDSGIYTFTSVPPDTYRIEIEAKGFKKLVLSNIVALVDIPKEANATLEAGNIAEVVNVTAGGLENVINTSDASLGNNFVAQQILQLPLNARNVANLLSLQPGVTPDGSVVGGRSDQANITLDGIDVNNQQDASAFAPVLRVNPDSVEEFRVTTSNPEASKGRSSGAQISLITKSGSNEFHGALYWYHRNTVTTANDWFSNAAGSFGPNEGAVLAGRAKAGDPRAPRPALLRNLFGGRIGGPIVKDRIFFFYNYEGMREAKQSAIVRLVPSASLGAGNIQFNDNTGQAWTITSAQINTFTLSGAPVVDVNPLVLTLFASVAARYPINDTTLGDGRNSGGFRFNAPVPVELNAHTARFDWAMTSDQKHHFSFRGNYQQDIVGAAPYFPDTPPTNTWSHPLGFSATHTWLLRNNMTNRFSYGLTRVAFSEQGDSSDPAITFRYIFQPVAFRRTFSRTNPTQNITDDFTWIKGNHTFQFGANIRLIKNTRVNFARSFDNGITNPSAYPSNVARVAINQYISAVTGSTRSVASSWDVPAQGSLVALLGRLSGYGANFNFDTTGQLLAANTGVKRVFKTNEYDWYFQDAWKLRSNLTLTLGLRYGLSMPVTETQGYETVPSIVLSEYLRRTIEAMNRGVNYREPLSVRRAGKANGLDSIYPLDKNNFQPRISVAWSPEFNSGLLSKLFGKGSESVLRGGFSITNDYFGQQLATQWDGANTLGFSSSATINVNTYNITTNPAPLYTGANMSIRSLPNLTIPGTLTFPQTAPFRNPGQGKIETSLDQNLVSPVNYSWNVSYGRRLPADIYVEASYIARLARNLLIGRDAMMLRDIRDPRSGLTYNQAATILDRQLQANVPITSIASIAFFDNMWAPGTLAAQLGCPLANCTNTQAVYYYQPLAGDWTYMMQELDGITGSRYFFQGQYDALSTFSTAGSSDYHGATLSVRQRMKGVTWDFNYTFSKSLDEASGLQTGGLFGSAFVLNAFNLRDQRAVSDFDLRHVINFNGIWDIPIGRNRRFGSGMNKFLNALVGGWQLSSIFRWDSGYPFTGGYFDSTGWQTNWNIRSYNTQLRPVSTGVFNSASASCLQAQQTNPNVNAGCTLPNLFSNPDAAYASFRTPHPGETGTRNAIRLPGSINLDAGLAKSFDLPWKEGHKVTFRWDVFNVTNTPIFSTQAIGAIGYTGSSAGTTFGRFIGTRNNARIMQFALRYDF